MRYPPEKIAATAIFLSFQVYRRPLPLSAEPDVPAEEGEAVEASKEAATFYDVCNILPGEVIGEQGHFGKNGFVEMMTTMMILMIRRRRTRTRRSGMYES